MKLNNLNITDACEDVANYFNSFDTPQEFVEKCNRGDWLLWLFKRTNPAHKRELTLAKAHCANTVRNLMKDKLSIDAVDIAIKYGMNEASEEELISAAAPAAAAAAAAAYAAAAAAAYAAYASASTSSASTAASSADAAYAYAYASSYASAADAIKKNRQLTADICRKYLPIEIWDFNNKETL